MYVATATHLRRGGINSDSIIGICSLYFDSEIILKISQYLTKLRRIKQSVPVFLGHPVVIVGTRLLHNLDGDSDLAFMIEIWQ